MRWNVLTIAKRLKTDSFLLLTLWNSYEFLKVTEMAMEINQLTSLQGTEREFQDHFTDKDAVLHNTSIETFLFISFFTWILGSNALRHN